MRRLGNHLDLVIVTGNLSVMSRWKDGYKKIIERLLSDLGATIIPYKGVNGLFDIYNQSDVVLFPRFLDNSYNMGHTEWKITLGMACGCTALVSAVPSYECVWKRSLGQEIILCETIDDWNAGFESLLLKGSTYEVRTLAKQLVDRHYSSRVIAAAWRIHSTAVSELSSIMRVVLSRLRQFFS